MSDTKALDVFIAFSEKDQDLLEELKTHLAILIHREKIRIWHRGMVFPGAHVGQADERLATADVILLLVTPSFLASSWETEIEPAMQRREAGDVLVVPIILKPVEWGDTPFEKLKVLPDNRKPVTSWSNPDEAFLNVTQGISRTVEEELRRRDAEEQELLTTLASVFGTEEAVHNLFDEAGIPQERVKPFGRDTPLGYWSAMCRELDKGLTEKGLRGLVEAAHRQYPHNRVFRRALDRLRDDANRAPRPPVPPDPPAPAPVPPSPVRDPSEDPFRVFLCCDPEDRNAVDALYLRLRDAGYAPWAAHRDLLPGQNKRHETARALRSSQAVVICLSRVLATRAGEGQRQLKLALDVYEEQPEGTIFLIPARLEDCDIPGALESLQPVDLFRPQGYEVLLRALS